MELLETVQGTVNKVFQGHIAYIFSLSESAREIL